MAGGLNLLNTVFLPGYFTEKKNILFYKIVISLVDEYCW